MIYAGACETVTGMDVIMGGMILGFTLIVLAMVIWAVGASHRN